MVHREALSIEDCGTPDQFNVVTSRKVELRVAAGLGSPLLSRRYELEIDSQPEGIQQQLHLLIRQVQEIPPAPSHTNLGDTISYELTIFSQDGERVFEGQSGSLPAAMQLLITFVKRLTAK